MLLKSLLFLFGCIPTRILLALTPFYLNKYLIIIFLLVVAISYLLIFKFHLRETGPEVFGHKIWWNNLRPIHALIYLIASYFIYNNKQNIGSKFLFLDVYIGLVAHIIYNYIL